ncbi:MAG TPA: LamG-like jellyroll fold domain-containing protein, partial [Chthoniobacteraceae bacterium]|nr:LamG-like jellyroll fold domain-containing protein [Chthoniobacteraceae bacterium]
LPPTGIPIGNIQSGFAWLHNYGKDLGALAFPPDGAETAPYPFYDRWGDSFNTTTEFVVVDQARSLATTAFLMAKTSLKDQPWKPIPTTIVGLPKSNSVGDQLSASLKADGLDLSPAQIVWEARDQEPFMSPQANFSPKNVGEQWIEAEALLPDGRRVFAKGMFSAIASMNVAPNAFFSSALQPNDGTFAVFHLDESLKDEAGHSPALRLAGKAAFDTSNLSWMSERKGAALRVKDVGDKATTKFSLPHPQKLSEITLQAMIYLNAFKAYNKANVKILSLTEDWNSYIELNENMYEGPMIKGGTEFSIAQTTLTNALKPATWNHLSITISKDSYTAHINGKVISTKKSAELAHWGRQPATLEFGNFDGYIDEVAILCKTASPVGAPAAAEDGAASQAQSASPPASRAE